MIELMLFLAISAIMIVTLLTGWTVAINTQSYKDASRSFASVLQGQYASTLNVVNDRSAKFDCFVNGGTTQVKAVTATSTSRGASDCVLIGRYITIDGSQMRSNAIVGTQPVTAIPSTTTEDQVIAAYMPGRIADGVINDDTYEIPWISTLYASSASPSALHIAIAIVRSPVTGTVRTYIKDITASDPTVTDVIAAPAAQAKRVLCMDPGTVVAQPRTAIVIAANAASSSAISVNADPTGSGC